MPQPKDNKPRAIVDYKNITHDLLVLLTETYPDGYEDETISFTNAKGERVEAVRLETETKIYLVKVSDQLDRKVEVFTDDQYDEDAIEDDSNNEMPDAKFEDD